MNNWTKLWGATALAGALGVAALALSPIEIEAAPKAQRAPKITKVVKTDAQWKALLSPAAYDVFRATPNLTARAFTNVRAATWTCSTRAPNSIPAPVGPVFMRQSKRASKSTAIPMASEPKCCARVAAGTWAMFSMTRQNPRDIAIA